jgi:hypothetical protein
MYSSDCADWIMFQFDNCGENKNQFVIGFSRILVRTKQVGSQASLCPSIFFFFLEGKVLLVIFIASISHLIALSFRSIVLQRLAKAYLLAFLLAMEARVRILLGVNKHFISALCVNVLC